MDKPLTIKGKKKEINLYKNPETRQVVNIIPVQILLRGSDNKQTW